jgi:predicted phage baseplate assembly protein
MALPEPILDDLRFQKDLVDEARRRIIRYCPEWTDYNLSDPGITLIELFAWMTEMITYRLNLVPDKNYIRFMDFLGIRLMPATSARTELTFRTSAPFPLATDSKLTAVVTQGTEVATRPTDEQKEVIFTTDEKLVIATPVLTQLRQQDEVTKNFLPRMGLDTFFAFNQPAPQPGDTFYLGFDETLDISGYILRLDFTCEQTQAAGIRREDPPLVWEVSKGNDAWVEIVPSTHPGERDTTGGLNNARGQIFFYLPLGLVPDEVHGRRAYWIRCRIEQRRKEQGMYRESPRILTINAYALGATTRATNAVIVENEVIGLSNGEAGQSFRLQHYPALGVREGETVEVEEFHDGELVFVSWMMVEDFSESDRHDRHCTLDTATGEVNFGPSLRQSDGSVRQYGRVPESGRRIRFSRYRYGGGVSGNVPPGKITVLKTGIAYIARVSNLLRATGGRDQESLEEAKMRTRRELRAQQRAVTSEDYENLGKAASRMIGRVKCNNSAIGGGTLPPGAVELLVIPAAYDAVNAGDLSKLALEPGLRQEIEAHLDKYRLMTATLKLREPTYIGVKVQADIVISDYSRPDAVQTKVRDALRNFISPLALGATSQGVAITDPAEADGRQSNDWQGWPFGRNLYVSELYSLIAAVPGVKHVREVQLGQRFVTPSKEAPPIDGRPVEQEAIVMSEKRLIVVPPDGILCSLEHVVNIVTL